MLYLLLSIHTSTSLLHYACLITPTYKAGQGMKASLIPYSLCSFHSSTFQTLFLPFTAYPLSLPHIPTHKARQGMKHFLILAYFLLLPFFHASTLHLCFTSIIHVSLFPFINTLLNNECLKHFPLISYHLTLPSTFVSTLHPLIHVYLTLHPSLEA